MRGLSKGFPSGGLGEKSGITWSCSAWRRAPIPGVSLVCGLGGHCLFRPGTNGSVMGI